MFQIDLNFDLISFDPISVRDKFDSNFIKTSVQFDFVNFILTNSELFDPLEEVWKECELLAQFFHFLNLMAENFISPPLK